MSWEFHTGFLRRTSREGLKMKPIGCCSIAVFCSFVALAAEPAAKGNQAQKLSDKEAYQEVEISPEILEKIRSAAAMIVYLDPVTGELRAPSAAERAALLGGQAARTQSLRSAPPKAMALPQGGFAVQADLGKLEYAVAVQGPDGKISYQCAQPGVAKTKARPDGRREER
jgi:hypothetical protein